MIAGKPVTADFYRATDLNAFPFNRVVDGRIAGPLFLPETAVIVGDLEHVSLKTIHAISVQGSVDDCIISTSDVLVEVHGRVVSTTIGTYGGRIQARDVVRSGLSGKVVRYTSIDSDSFVNSRRVAK